MMQRFYIYKVAEDGVSVFVQDVRKLEEAQRIVRNLAEIWPGEYLISEKSESPVLAQVEEWRF